MPYKNPSDRKAADLRYRQKNLERERARKREYMRKRQKEAPEKARAAAIAWLSRNPEWIERNRGRANERAKKWAKDNPGRANARTRHRQARQLRACPSWADRAAIAEFYMKAVQMTKDTGIPHEVDHIIPLVSTVVCGLHVPSNLEVIPAVENRKKSNRMTTT
jgi:hypothetical protein